MTLSGYQVTLRTVSESDLELLRQWRNTPEISQHMLSQDEISAEQQRRWFQKISVDPCQQHFVIEYKGQAIGSANIQLREGESLKGADVIEPGLYIFEPKYRGNILAFAPTLLLNDYCFEQLNVKVLKAVVKKENSAALSYNQKLGYKIISQNELVAMDLTCEDYQQATGTIKRFLSR